MFVEVSEPATYRSLRSVLITQVKNMKVKKEQHNIYWDMTLNQRARSHVN